MAVKAVLDTNILIDYLVGLPEAAQELELYDDPLISITTWMEVMAGSGDSERQATRRFLAGFRLVELTTAIAERAVILRQELRIKLPDAIILASARNEGCILVTRNTRDFDPAQPDIRLPYRLN